MSDYKFHNKLSIKGKNWQLKQANREYLKNATQLYGISELSAILLYNRNVDIYEIENFLDPKLRNNLPEPFSLKDMEKAVDEIYSAIKNKKKITVYGDYDVDGATSTALIKRYMNKIGVDVEIYIPDRLSEGYGVNADALLSLREKGTDLVITVDCGVVSFEPIAQAKKAGLDVIVIDHHISMETLPDAKAVVNPNRLDETGDLKNLCAAGVTYIMLIALNRKLRNEGFFNKENEPDLMSLLDLVALGTVCDVMLIQGVNRSFVSQGLKVLSKRSHLGLKKLCDIAEIDKKPDVHTLGFVIGPRINAAGRISDCSLGSKILSSDDEAETDEFAVKLNQLNKERQQLEKRTLEQALEYADNINKNLPFLMVSGKGWHPGIIGIVASRIKEHFNKPTAIIALSEGIGRASARSVGDVDIGRAITNAKAEGLLISGGGHKSAAGFTVSEDKILSLNDYICEKLQQPYIKYANDNTLKADFALDVESITISLVDEISKLEPYGNGNLEPKFIIENAKIVSFRELANKHLSIYVSSSKLIKNTSKAIKCIFFNALNTEAGEMIKAAKMKEVCILGKIKRNIWQGNESAEIIVEDIIILDS